jgi:hypothetical protein
MDYLAEPVVGRFVLTVYLLPPRDCHGDRAVVLAYQNDTGETILIRCDAAAGAQAGMDRRVRLRCNAADMSAAAAW